MELIEEQNISVKTAKLAIAKGCELDLYNGDWEYEDEYGDTFVCNFDPSKDKSKVKKNLRQVTRCTQSLLQTWLRKRNIIVLVHNPAGYKCTVNGLSASPTAAFASYEDILEVGLLAGLKKYKKPRKKKKDGLK